MKHKSWKELYAILKESSNIERRLMRLFVRIEKLRGRVGP